MARALPKVTKEWALREKEFAEKMGLEFWSEAPPKYFSDLDSRRMAKTMMLPESYLVLNSELKRFGFHSFRPHKVLFNRFFRNLVDERNRVVIHTAFNNFERHVYFSFGWRWFCMPDEIDSRRVTQIVKELQDGKQVDGQVLSSMD